MLAVAGALFFVLDRMGLHHMELPSELLKLTFLAGGVSIVSLFSITLNQTPDDTYVSYISSFFVWLFSAYAVCSVLERLHGNADVRLVFDYMLGVSVFQCIMAVLIDVSPVVKSMVDLVFFQNQELLHRIKRLYGIGASLDSAGVRFSVVLAAAGFFLSGAQERFPPVRQAVYVLSFLLVTVIGNMISRTTIVGFFVGLAVIIGGRLSLSKSQRSREGVSNAWIWFLSICLVFVICVGLYRESEDARKMFLFGFEGFFSLFQSGRFSTGSGEVLRTMYVFPESIHTWIIGDGYFLNSRYDPNYLGNAPTGGYYMGTDVGYLRFIFYFGLVGFFFIFSVMAYSAAICWRNYYAYRRLFLALFLVGLIIWFKVATDVFFFFALYISLSFIYNNLHHEKNGDI